MRRKTFWITIFAAVFGLLPFLFGDTIYLYDGRVIRGEIIQEDEFYVVVKTEYGILRLEKGEIERIDRKKTPEEIHEERWKKCKTARDFYELGKWAESKGLRVQALRDYEKAIELDPNFAPARKALGHIYYKGRWWTKEEYYEKVKGLVYRNGKWIPKKVAEEMERRLIEKRRAEVRRLWKKRREELKGIPWVKALQNPIETRHYIVYCNSSPRVAKMYANFLEQLFEKFDKIFYRYRPVYEKIIRERKCVVMIHRNYEEFLNMHGLPPGVGGFYLPKPRGTTPGRTVVAFHGSFGDTGNTFTVLAHEGTHQFEHLIMSDIMNRPIWLIEGLAVFFGDGHVILPGGRLKVGVIPRDRLAVLQQAIRKGKYIRLKQLIRTTQQRFTGFHYAHAWGLIYYMLDPEKRVKNRTLRRKMQKLFQDFFDLNCRKTFDKHPVRNTLLMASHFEKMIQKELGKSIDQFEEDWKKFILSLELPVVGKIRGNVFHSKIMKFRIAKPRKYSWKFDTRDLRRGEKVAIVNERSTGRVGVVAVGNNFLMTPKELARNYAFGLRRKFKNLQVLEAGTPVDHRGYEGYRFRFRGIPIPTVETGEVRKTEQTFEVYVFATIDNLYILKFQADSDKFEKNKHYFQWIKERFEILAK